jgi:hypothetical protein
MFYAPELVFGGTVGPVIMFSLPDTFSAVRRASDTVLKYCALGLVSGGTDGVGSPFQVLRSGTHFWRCRGRRVPLSYFALPDTFSAVPRASGPVFMFCAPGLIFGGSEGVRTHFHILRSGTSFWLYRVCRVTFSCFAFRDTFSAVPSGSGHIFMFCAP